MTPPPTPTEPAIVPRDESTPPREPSREPVVCEFCECKLSRTGAVLRVSDRMKALRAFEDDLIVRGRELDQLRGQLLTVCRYVEPNLLASLVVGRLHVNAVAGGTSVDNLKIAKLAVVSVRIRGDVPTRVPGLEDGGVGTGRDFRVVDPEFQRRTAHGESRDGGSAGTHAGGAGGDEDMPHAAGSVHAAQENVGVILGEGEPVL